MSGLVSGIYVGEVTHARLKGRRHSLAYRMFMLLIDLDEAEQLDRSCRLFRWNRAGLAAVLTRDYGDRSGADLKAQVEQRLAAVQVKAGGAIRMLTMPRVLGAAFNPLTVFFCHRPDGSLGATLYEVTNTYGERHSYVVPVTHAGQIRQSVDKAFYVSPFLDQDLGYAFRVRRPGERVAIGIDAKAGGEAIFSAVFAAERRPFTDRELLGALWACPVNTLGAWAAIHWQALKLWLKGERVRRRPPAPTCAVTLGREDLRLSSSPEAMAA